MKKTVCFFNEKLLNDNCLSLSEYFDSKLKDNDIKIIQIFRQKNFISKVKFYFKMLFRFFIKYDVMVSDYLVGYMMMAKKGILTQHGYGVKSTPGIDENKIPEFIKKTKKRLKHLNYIITLSKRDEYIYRCGGCYDEIVKNIKYLPIGLPRNDYLVSNNNSDFINSLKNKYGLNGKKVLLYCPTWRQYGPQKFPLSLEEFKEIVKYLAENGWILAYRPHPAQSIIPEEYLNISNVIILDSKKEKSSQNVLLMTDFLITDYSTIYVDYLLLDRPMAFLPFDEEKMRKEVGLLVDYNNKMETPGEKILNYCDFKRVVIDCVNNQDLYATDRKKAIELFHKNNVGNSCELVWNLIREIIK